jgi:hypothetical protein
MSGRLGVHSRPGQVQIDFSVPRKSALSACSLTRKSISIVPMKALFSIIAVVLLAGGTAFAAGSKTYQVTGPVLEINDSMIAVQKGKDRWEIARDSSTKVNGDLKVGAKVTITYTMSATEVEVKGDKAADKGAKKK